MSIDAKKIDSDYFVFINNGTIDTGIKVAEWAKKVEELGAGEVLINSIERDGSREGYDLQLLNLVSSSVNIPVIACGGVGNMRHLASGIIEGNCKAVAAANIFHYRDQSVFLAKKYLYDFKLNVRKPDLIKF